MATTQKTIADSLTDGLGLTKDPRIVDSREQERLARVGGGKWNDHMIMDDVLGYLTHGTHLQLQCSSNHEQ